MYSVLVSSFIPIWLAKQAILTIFAGQRILWILKLPPGQFELVSVPSFPAVPLVYKWGSYLIVYLIDIFWISLGYESQNRVEHQKHEYVDIRYAYIIYIYLHICYIHIGSLCDLKLFNSCQGTTSPATNPGFWSSSATGPIFASASRAASAVPTTERCIWRCWRSWNYRRPWRFSSSIPIWQPLETSYWVTVFCFIMFYHYTYSHIQSNGC